MTYAIEEEGIFDAVMDMAVAIRTKHRMYTFSRDVWFSTAFSVAEGDDIEIGYSELECAEKLGGRAQRRRAA